MHRSIFTPNAMEQIKVINLSTLSFADRYNILTQLKVEGRVEPDQTFTLNSLNRKINVRINVRFTERFSLKSKIINPLHLEDPDDNHAFFTILNNHLNVSIDSGGTLSNDIIPARLPTIFCKSLDGISHYTLISVDKDLIIYSRKKSSRQYRIAVLEHRVGKGSFSNVILSNKSISFDLVTKTTKIKVKEKSRAVKMFDSRMSLDPQELGGPSYESKVTQEFAPYLRAKAASLSSHIPCISVRKGALIMAYLEGNPLSDYTVTDEFEKRKKLFTSDRERIEVCIALARLIKQLEELNAVHRDIKPENLILKRLPDGTIDLKLIDFGFAVRADENHKVACGTPDFVAPEIVRLQGAGLPSNRYSFARVCEEIFSRYPAYNYNAAYQSELPFIYNDIADKYDDHADRHLYEEQLNTLLAKILIEDPEKRLDIDAIIDGFENILNSTLAYEAPALPSLRK